MVGTNETEWPAGTSFARRMRMKLSRNFEGRAFGPSTVTSKHASKVPIYKTDRNMRRSLKFSINKVKATQLLVLTITDRSDRILILTT